jgi:hypothetical protein
MTAKFDYKFSRNISIRYKGELISGIITVGGIEQLEESERWKCYYTISMIHPERGHIWGADPLDALSNCLVFLDGLIKGSEEDGLEIWWQHEGDHCGMLRGGTQDI